MKYMKKPEVVEAYIYGEDKEAFEYVKKNKDDRPYVINRNGLKIDVRKGDYIIPHPDSFSGRPIAQSVNPKLFVRYYRKLEKVDQSIIDKWEDLKGEE